MLFPTVRFAVFSMATWGALLVVRDRPVARRMVLLAASWVFYASWDWRWLALLWWMIGANHVAARWIARAPSAGRQRLALGVGVLANLALLGWFKYWDFFTGSVVGALDAWASTRPCRWCRSCSRSASRSSRSRPSATWSRCIGA